MQRHTLQVLPALCWHWKASNGNNLESLSYSFTLSSIKLLVCVSTELLSKSSAYT